MGGTNSRPAFSRSNTNQSSTSPENPHLRRSSKHRRSKTERANAISVNLQNVRSQIESFDGFRGDSRYQSIQSELTQFSQEVQDVKSRAKPATRDICSNIQADIVDLLRKLEEIVERNEGELDLAAIESHSFIDQTPNLKKKAFVPISQEPVTAQKNASTERDRDRNMMNITELEESTNSLMKEINRAIELENVSEFVVFEKKIGILYADLTTIDVEKNDPLYERKESISRKLIRYNNKLKSHKNRNSGILDKETNKAKKAEKEIQTINQIEETLVDIEVKVMLFEDVKGDPKYRELDQILKGYWAKLQGLEDSSEESRRKKLKAINLIKTNLHALNSKAEENSTKIKNAIEKINGLEDDVLAMKVVVDGYQGFKNDLDYTNIDQTIRSLWAKLNDIHSANSKVEQKKNETIKIIQNMLKTLAENAEKYETKAAKAKEKLNSVQVTWNENVNKDKLIEELNDFKEQWKRLSCDIEKYLTTENQDNVETVLTTVQNDINNYITKLPDKTGEFKRRNTGDKRTSSSQSLNKMNKNRASVGFFKSKEEKSRSKSTGNLLSHEKMHNELPTSFTVEQNATSASSVEQIIDEIEYIQAKLKSITNSIETCPPNECASYKMKLEEVEHDLNKVETNLNPVVTESKTDVINTIRAAYKMIDERSRKDGKEETAKLKTIVENLQKLKKKVDCFSGTHGNIQYVEIERELNGSMDVLDGIDCQGNEKLLANKKQIKQKINHYLNILDERSLKIGSQEDIVAEVKNESVVENTNILVKKLTEIRGKLENFEANKTNNFDEDFNNAKILLDRIDDKRNADYYDEYLKQLITYYKSKVNDISPLLNLEQIVNNLKLEATELDNIMQDNQNINQRISTTLTQIRNLPAHGESETLKSKLMNDIKTIAALLQTKDAIIKDLDAILEEINRFSGTNYTKKYDEIDEKLSAVLFKVQDIPVTAEEEYVHLRNNLIRKIQNHKKKLNAKMASLKEPNGDLDGTEV